MNKTGIRFVLALWLGAVILQVRREITSNKGVWPKPAVLVKTTLAFSALGLLTMIQPEIAAALAVGLFLALLINNPALISG